MAFIFITTCNHFIFPLNVKNERKKEREVDKETGGECCLRHRNKVEGRRNVTCQNSQTARFERLFPAGKHKKRELASQEVTD